MAESFKIAKNNKAQVLSNLKAQIEAALEDCGLDAEGYAKVNLRNKKAVDTGNLLNSITHEVEMEGDGGTMRVGSAVEYAPYVELGTGVYVTGGRRTSWVFKDSKGKWHRTKGMPERPYIKPAISEHKEDYIDIIKEHLQK